MRTAILCVMSVAFLAGPAFAADPLAGLYGNTIVTKSASGQEARISYKADHTFSGTDPNGKVSGVWEVKGDQFCVTAKEPAEAAKQGAHCGPLMADKKVGDSWDAQGPNGEKVTMTIVQGMQ